MRRSPASSAESASRAFTSPRPFKPSTAARAAAASSPTTTDSSAASLSSARAADTDHGAASQSHTPRRERTMLLGRRAMIGLTSRPLLGDRFGRGQLELRLRAVAANPRVLPVRDLGLAVGNVRAPGHRADRAVRLPHHVELTVRLHLADEHGLV